MIVTWRLIVAAVLSALAYLLAKPVMEALLNAIRRRIGKGFQWIADMQRYMLLYLSWICFVLLLISIFDYILHMGDNDAVMNTLKYALAVPVVLGTFALRKVVTNMIVRHFEWDQDTTEYDTRIFVVTEGINTLVFVLIVVEIFYIFFVSNEMAQFLLIVVLASLEVLAVSAGFTTLKNIGTGLFLIFAEPFRTGSFCKIHNLVGFIERVSLARTTLRRHDGSLVFIPNGVFADWHQTNGNAQEAQLHELVLEVQPTAPIEKIQQFIDELLVILPQFAMSDDVVTASYRGSESAVTPQSTRYPNEANQSFVSTDVRTDERSYRVVLCAMYRVKMSILVDRTRFASLEAVKTEVLWTESLHGIWLLWLSKDKVANGGNDGSCLYLMQINMAIVESLQRIGIVAKQRDS